MFDAITEEHRERYAIFNDFVKAKIEPHATEWDREEAVSDEILKICGETGYLGCSIPEEYGGKGWDMLTFGLLNEAVARGSVSLEGIFNVHTMVAQTILKWGTDEQRQRYLPAMAKGEVLGAFALTEPNAGSDVQGIESTFTDEGDHFLLNGTKRWITFGAVADVLLVFGKIEGKPLACLVDSKSEGFRVKPVKDMLGFRAAHLAVLEFENIKVPKENQVGKPGVALNYLAPYALEYGRLAVAWSSLGILRACLEICGDHVHRRKAFGQKLIDHGMIRTLMADMGVEYELTKMMCISAAIAKDRHLHGATERTLMAKYYAAMAASRHASNAVQIMGALGCNENFAVSRFYRDAKTMEIIEGSNQIQQRILGKSVSLKAARGLGKI